MRYLCEAGVPAAAAGRQHGWGRRIRWMAPLALLAGLLLAVTSGAGDTAAEKEKARADIRKMATETLSRLYKEQPSAKNAIAKAAGYAVFSNFGMKILLFGSGTGAGIAVNNSSKKETFMKMVEVQAGLGLGVKKFRLVWVFMNRKDLDAFVNSGWELGGQTSAAAQVSGQGAALAGAISVSPGIWLYQLTDEGLAVELTAKGTKYYKNDELN
jgi:lipid-binding SYLF domain-containing protein